MIAGIYAAVGSVAAGAYSLTRTGGCATGAVHRFGMAAILSTGMGMRSVIVGNPCAPSVHMLTAAILPQHKFAAGACIIIYVARDKDPVI